MSERVSVYISNLFGAFKFNESKNLKDTLGLKDHLDSVGNSFAVITILCFLVVNGMLLPKEEIKLG